VRGGWLSRLQLVMPRLTIIAAVTVVLILFPNHQAREDGKPMLFEPAPALGWLAAVLTVAGIGFAICARVHLGRNWSSRPSIKEGHELVTSGPYRIVRHPIYTGMLVAIVGLALAGTIAGLVALVFAVVVFLRRVVREERIMTELFPTEYPAYRARTSRLIPLVW
jgi:protein-S-isoprenylcysteine O-methyltransferase Ste14